MNKMKGNLNPQGIRIARMTNTDIPKLREKKAKNRG